MKKIVKLKEGHNNFFQKNRRGQFYLLATVIIVFVVMSFSFMFGVNKTDSSTKVYDLEKELNIESEKVMEYALLNGLDVLTVMDDFTSAFSVYAGEEVEIYYITGQNGSIRAYTYDDGKTYIPITEDRGKASFSLNDVNYNISVREGENFYFVINQQSGGQFFSADNIIGEVFYTASSSSSSSGGGTSDCGQEESTIRISCEDILNNCPTQSDGAYWINPSTLPFRVYCDMTTEDGGWTLFAITDNYECAERVGYGPTEITSLDDSVFLTTLLRESEHESFLQVMMEDGSNPTYTIVYNFGNTKTLRNRIDDAVNSGEQVNWKITYGENVYNYGPYLWWFSSNARTSDNWDSSGTKFSYDDGSWGGAQSDINGNQPGPYLKGAPNSWGHENDKGNDNNCKYSLREGVKYKNDYLKNYLFIR